MGYELPHRVRQIPRSAARQQSHRRSAPSGVLSQRWEHARCSEGQTLAAVDALDESGDSKTPAVKPSVRPQPARNESLLSQAKSGTMVDLPLSRGHGTSFEELVRLAA